MLSAYAARAAAQGAPRTASKPAAPAAYAVARALLGATPSLVWEPCFIRSDTISEAALGMGVPGP